MNKNVESGGKNTSKFTHVHCWTPNHGFSRSRQHVDDEPSMCSSVQLTSATSVGRRRPIRRQYLRVSLPKTGPLRFGSENQFPLNFAHEYILVQKKLKPH